MYDHEGFFKYIFSCICLKRLKAKYSRYILGGMYLLHGETLLKELTLMAAKNVSPFLHAWLSGGGSTYPGLSQKRGILSFGREKIRTDERGGVSFSCFS